MRIQVGVRGEPSLSRDEAPSVPLSRYSVMAMTDEDDEQPKRRAPTPPDPSIIKLLNEQWEDPKIRKRIRGLAFLVCRSEAHIPDLMGDAYVRVAEGRRRWNPKTHPDLAHYLGLVMKSIWGDRWRSAQAKHEVKQAAADEDAKGERDDDAPSSKPDPEMANVGKQDEIKFEKLKSALLTELKEDGPIALRWWALTQDGIYDQAEQAELLGLTQNEIESLHKRVRRILDRLFQEKK